jgi:hypothetical protein
MEIATMALFAAYWLWHGFLARGNFSLLTGQGKGRKVDAAVAAPMAAAR